jgi:hypothetical protein
MGPYKKKHILFSRKRNKRETAQKDVARIIEIEFDLT